MNFSQRLTLLSVLCATLGTASAAAQSTHNFDPIVQPEIDNHQITGAVTLVATKDRILAEEAIGYSDLAAKTPMKSDAFFWIASMSKPITATCFMMLVDEGKIDLDAPVEKYLPEFKGQRVLAHSGAAATTDVRTDQNAANAAEVAANKGETVPASHPITIREILSHSAGLPFSSSIEHGFLDTRPLKDAVAQYGKDPLIFQPGTEYKYANEGLNTAGRIIEVVSGMPYEKFLQTRLFDPLGMVDTTFWPTPAQQARMPKSYKSDGNGGLMAVPVGQVTYPLEDHAHRFPFPAGGLFSTSEDMMRFGQMLLNGGVYHGRRLLSEKAIGAMTTKETPDAVKQKYGFGMTVFPFGFGHGGAFKTDITISTRDGLVMIFMVQKADQWQPQTEGGKVQHAILDRGVALLPTSASH